jgi:hypothetical protein
VHHLEKKQEAEDTVHGALRWTVNLLAGIFTFGWTDGCPVHMLLTAGDSHYEESTPFARPQPALWSGAKWSSRRLPYDIA